jgi:glutamate-1-semialdehyde 2,1-aminomutase
MTTLGKIVSGGYPGAAVVGRGDAMNMLAYRQEAGRIQPPPVPHQGTYNAGPVSAAAGIATLLQVRDTNAVQRAIDTAAKIRAGMNAAIQRRGLNWCVYGLFSDFHIHCGEASLDDIYSGKVSWKQLKGSTPAETIHQIRTGMLVHGVDIMGWPGGLVSAVHTDEDVRRTVDAFDATLGMLL